MKQTKKTSDTEKLASVHQIKPSRQTTRTSQQRQKRTQIWLSSIFPSLYFGDRWFSAPWGDNGLGDVWHPWQCLFQRQGAMESYQHKGFWCFLQVASSCGSVENSRWSCHFQRKRGSFSTERVNWCKTTRIWGRRRWELFSYTVESYWLIKDMT